MSTVMRPAGASVAMRVTAPLRSRKLARHAARSETAKSRNRRRASLLKVTLIARAGRVLLQLVIQIRLDVFAPRGQAGQAERPQVDAGKQILAEPAARHFRGQIAIGAGDQLEIALHFPIRADRQKTLFLDRPQKHGLFVDAQFADLVEKEHAAVGRPQQARADRSWRR